MALDFSQYAQSYGGGYSPQAGAQIGAGLGAALGRIPNFQQRFTRKLRDELVTGENAVLQPVRDAYIGDVKDVNFTGMLNAGTAYKNFKEGMEGRFGKRAQRKGLLDPVAFKQIYDQQVSSMAPTIGNKIVNYARLNKMNDTKMKEFVQERGLNSFILSNFTDPNDPNTADLIRWATPSKTLREQFGDIKDYWKTGWTPTGAIGAGATVGTGIGLTYLAKNKLGKGMFKGALTSKTPEILGTGSKGSSQQLLATAKSKYESLKKASGGPGVQTATGKELKRKIATLTKNITKKESLIKASGITQATTKLGTVLRTAKGIGIYAGVPIAAEKVGEIIGGEKAGAVTGRTVQAAMSSTIAGIQLAVKKKGTRWLLTQMAKKGGAGLGLRLAAKLGLGAVGGAATGGTMTLLMGALAVKDLYQLSKLITEIVKES